MTENTPNPASYDAVIIGAGVIGASVALGLSRKGYRTLNVDALPAAGYGSTSNSSAVIRPYYSAVESCALAHESRHHWLSWPEFLGVEDESGYAKYIECGFLVLMSEDGRAQATTSVRALEDVGVLFERLSTEDIAKRWPSITTASFGPPKQPDHPGFGEANEAPLAGGVFMSQAGFVNDPQLAAHNLQRAAEALGAAFRFNTNVAKIDRDEGRVTGITTDKGETIRAPVVVNVAGPHSSKINALAGVFDDMDLTTSALRHEVAHVPAPRGFEIGTGGCAVADGDAGVYYRAEISDHLMVGTLDPECDGKDVVDPDDYNTEFTSHWTRQVWRAAQRFPQMGIPNTAQGVVGLYDVTEDWNPIYDKSSLPGFYMAIGTSGNQFKNAPMVGEVMAELILACEAGQDHDNDPVQFHLPHLDRSISLGFYSRRRNFHADSSGTVLA